jgi:hypothetical protein
MTNKSNGFSLCAHSSFTPPSKNSTCNSIAWNGQDCGECIIDENGNPSFDCSAFGGPDGTTIGEDDDNPGGPNDTTSAALNNARWTVTGSLLAGVVAASLVI